MLQCCNVSLPDSDYQTTVTEIVLDSSLLPSEKRNFTITLIDDSLLEGNETFEISFSSTSQAMLRRPTITVTIVDDEGEGWCLEEHWRVHGVSVGKRRKRREKRKGKAGGEN